MSLRCACTPRTHTCCKLWRSAFYVSMGFQAPRRAPEPCSHLNDQKQGSRRDHVHHTQHPLSTGQVRCRTLVQHHLAYRQLDAPTGYAVEGLCMMFHSERCV